MQERFRITGRVAYQHIGPGFWGIIGEGGQQWRPDWLPHQLQHEGARVELLVRALPDAPSIFMWGRPVRILSFHTLS